jgi:hypothetical protein
MTSHILIAVAIAVSAASSLLAQEDSIADALDHARTIYEATVDQATEELQQRLEDEKQKAQNSANLVQLQKLDEEIKVFKESRKLPSAVNTRKYVNAIVSGQKKFLNALAHAKRQYTKNGDTDLASLVQEEIDELEPPVVEDSLQAGTKWIGEMTRVAKGEADIGRQRVNLEVLERDGNSFSARLEIQGEGIAHHVRLVKGTISRGRVMWLAKNVQVLKGHEGHDHAGAIKGDRMELQFRGLTHTGGKPVAGKIVLDKKSTN